VVAVVAALLSVSSLERAAADPVPCDALSGEDEAKYFELDEQAKTAYGEGRYLDAIDDILGMREICGEDPVLAYNLARSYDRAGNCNMALFWYDRVLDWETSKFPNLVERQRVKAGEKKTAMQARCANSARVSIECAGDGEIEVKLGDAIETSCPFEGRVDAGTYTLRATSEGHETYTTEANIVAGQTNRLLVPMLDELVTTGRIVGAGLDGQALDCPGELELSTGEYQLTMGEHRLTASVAAGETTNINFAQYVVERDLERVGIFIDLRVSPGSGFAEGSVYDKNNEDEVATLDGTQPTQFTFALVNEIGYDITDWFGVGAHIRLELANFSALGAALVRFTPYRGEWVSIRLSLIGGGGTLLRPVEVTDVGTALARMGPGFAGAAAGIGINVSELFAIVLDFETKVGFPDFGVHMDWASTGVEVAF